MPGVAQNVPRAEPDTAKGISAACRDAAQAAAAGRPVSEEPAPC